MIILNNKISREIINYLKPFHPEMIGIFGSYARNEEKEYSDLDILVDFKKSINLFDLIGIEMELSEKLGVKVDLITNQSVHPGLRPYIEKDLKIILHD